MRTGLQPGPVVVDVMNLQGVDAADIIHGGLQWAWANGSDQYNKMLCGLLSLKVTGPALLAQPLICCKENRVLHF